MRIAEMLILHLRRHFRARSTEWFLAGVMLAWGLVLLWRPAAMSSPAFSILDEVAGVRVWAWLCFGMGLARLVVLGINGLLRPSPHLRAGLAGFSVLFWLQVVGAGLSSPAGIAFAFALPAIIFDALNVWYGMEDAGRVDKDARR